MKKLLPILIMLISACTPISTPVPPTATETATIAPSAIVTSTSTLVPSNTPTPEVPSFKSWGAAPISVDNVSSFQLLAYAEETTYFEFAIIGSNISIEISDQNIYAFSEHSLFYQQPVPKIFTFSKTGILAYENVDAGIVQIVDLKTEKIIRTLGFEIIRNLYWGTYNDGYKIVEMKLSRNGENIVVVFKNNTASIVDLITGEETQILQGIPEYLNVDKLSFFENDKYLVFFGRYSNKIFDIEENLFVNRNADDWNNLDFLQGIVIHDIYWRYEEDIIQCAAIIGSSDFINMREVEFVQDNIAYGFNEDNRTQLLEFNLNEINCRERNNYGLLRNVSTTIDYSYHPPEGENILDISKDGKYLVLLDNRNIMTVIERETGIQVARLGGIIKSIDGASISQSGKMVVAYHQASGYYDRVEAKVFQINTERNFLISSKKVPLPWGSGKIVFSPDEEFAIIGGNVYAANGTRMWGTAYESAIYFSVGSDLLIVKYENWDTGANSIKFYNTNLFHLVHEISIESWGNDAITLSPDGKHIFIGTTPIKFTG